MLLNTVDGDKKLNNFVNTSLQDKEGSKESSFGNHRHLTRDPSIDDSKIIQQDKSAFKNVR